MDEANQSEARRRSTWTDGVPAGRFAASSAMAAAATAGAAPRSGGGALRADCRGPARGRPHPDGPARRARTHIPGAMHRFAAGQHRGPRPPMCCRAPGWRVCRGSTPTRWQLTSESPGVSFRNSTRAAALSPRRAAAGSPCAPPLDDPHQRSQGASWPLLLLLLLLLTISVRQILSSSARVNWPGRAPWHGACATLGRPP